ncbi:sulfotransferase [Phenylobacterium sp. VNQ135]|uniref:tetratricopeptide repeat-containing sulfotransferase family protein n=1 Tax=Phenylobacterium sp. VNQ135 TaxID=3400922 RepID=UPI003BFDEBFD
MLRPELQQARAVDARHSLALEALLRSGRRLEAVELFEAARALEAPSPDALDALAFYARRLDRHELSNALYRRAAETAQDDAQLWYNLATSERSLGRLAAAAEACNRALALEPQRFGAVLLRSELVRATPEANHVHELQAKLAAEAGSAGRMFLAYALGKELHDLSRYDEAFEAFALGAHTRRRGLRYEVAEDERKLARIQAAYAAQAPSSTAPSSPARHVFIVGLPRSGTTLTERILGGLPGVHSNGETDNFAAALLRSAPAGDGDIFDRCARANGGQVAKTYEALAAPDRRAGTILEKLPMNYLYLGAIARALPEARIVWLRRHPLDSCFAMFRTLFGEAYPFSYDFHDLARYYAAYARLMTHWRATLGERLLAVDYEALVETPAAVAPTLARHCGLPWAEAALEITNNRSASLTASAVQVREPIHGRSAGLWRRYERHLQPLEMHLRSAGVAL